MRATRRSIRAAGYRNCLARDERSRAERDRQLVPRVLVVAACLLRALRHAHRVQGHHPGRGEVVERGVDVPAVEARGAGCLIRGRHGRLVDGGVGAWRSEGTRGYGPCHCR